MRTFLTHRSRIGMMAGIIIGIVALAFAGVAIAAPAAATHEEVISAALSDFEAAVQPAIPMSETSTEPEAEPAPTAGPLATPTPTPAPPPTPVPTATPTAVPPPTPAPVVFTAAQAAQVARLSPERRAGLSDQFLGKRTAPELRARVNVLGVSDTVRFAPESDYSAEDRALIQAVRPRSEWLIAIPALLERAETLRGEGLSEAAITAILCE